MRSWVLLIAAQGSRQRWLREELERRGFVVETARTLDDAITSLTVIRPSMIVIDEPVLTADERKKLDADAPTQV